jgi:hypothetical protein
MFYVITHERSMAALLSEEDLEGMELVKIHRFAEPAERLAYLRERGWM